MADGAFFHGWSKKDIEKGLAAMGCEKTMKEQSRKLLLIREQPYSPVYMYHRGYMLASLIIFSCRIYAVPSAISGAQLLDDDSTTSLKLETRECLKSMQSTKYEVSRL